MKNTLAPALLCASLLLAAATLSAAPAPADPALTQLALDNLHAVVANNHDLPRMHAAEDLAILGDPDPLAVIRSELPALATQPIFRIVMWRVQARAAAVAHQSMKPQTDKVLAIFFTQPDTSDRVNAAETLGKLAYNPTASEAERFRPIASGKDPMLALHASWVLAGNSHAAEEKALAAFLKNPDPKVRGDAAYALRFRPRLRKETKDELIAAAKAEPIDSPARCYLLTSATLRATGADRALLLHEVEKYAEKGNAEEKYEAMNGLALFGGPDEIARLRGYLQPPLPYSDTDADVRVAAANAILHIQRK